jgi:hypothetical protein
MHSRLSCQGFRHGYKAADLKERATGFRKFRKQVRIDRVNNLKAAEEQRLETVLEEDLAASRSEALESGALSDTTDDEQDDGY